MHKISQEQTGARVEGKLSGGTKGTNMEEGEEKGEGEWGKHATSVLLT